MTLLVSSTVDRFMFRAGSCNRCDLGIGVSDDRSRSTTPTRDGPTTRLERDGHCLRARFDNPLGLRGTGPRDPGGGCARRWSPHAYLLRAGRPGSRGGTAPAPITRRRPSVRWCARPRFLRRRRDAPRGPEGRCGLRATRGYLPVERLPYIFEVSAARALLTLEPCDGLAAQVSDRRWRKSVR